ncbi:unnamed protein product [Leuciscus chuanchicus]
MTYLDEKFADPDTDDLLDMATFMDPRFKGQYIRPEKAGAIQMRAVSEIMDEDQGKLQAGPSEEAADQGAEGGSASGPTLPLGVKKQRKSLGSFFKKQYQEEDALPLTEKQKVESELERYLMCPDADRLCAMRLSLPTFRQQWASMSFERRALVLKKNLLMLVLFLKVLKFCKTCQVSHLDV